MGQASEEMPLGHSAGYTVSTNNESGSMDQQHQANDTESHQSQSQLHRDYTSADRTEHTVESQDRIAGLKHESEDEDEEQHGELYRGDEAVGTLTKQGNHDFDRDEVFDRNLSYYSSPFDAESCSPERGKRSTEDRVHYAPTSDFETTQSLDQHISGFVGEADKYGESLSEAFEDEVHGYPHELADVNTEVHHNSEYLAQPTEAQTLPQDLWGSTIYSQAGPSVPKSLSPTILREEAKLESSSDEDEPLVSRMKQRAPTFDKVTLTSRSRTGQNDPDTIHNEQSDAPGSPDHDCEEICWKLPTYEVYRENPESKDPTTKVSIPGIVREEIILSPDHESQEFELLQNVFLPAQEARQFPDPEPAMAIVNFHNISVMVIETFEQFVLGDAIGGEAMPTKPTKDSKSADVDEIFFSTIDRWRSGISCNNKKYAAIRGIQEFCDVALDLIFYIKEHGLLSEKPKLRKQRSDKGVQRGSRAKKENEDPTTGHEEAAGYEEEYQGEMKAGKRSSPARVNEIQPRKKAKTAKQAPVKPAPVKGKTTSVKGKGKSKQKSSSKITVIKTHGK